MRLWPCSFLLLLTTSAWTVGSAQVGSIPSADQTRIAKLDEALLASQHADGAIVEVAYPETSIEEDANPYFAAYACMGALGDYAYRKNPADLQFVLKWLNWFANHQNQSTKSISNFALDYDYATKEWNYTPQTPDSQDAYAGMFLLVAGRYSELSGRPLPVPVIHACINSLILLKALQQPTGANQGVFWDWLSAEAPTGVTPGQYEADNVEAYQGLISIFPALTKNGFAPYGELASTMAAALANKMVGFWSTAANPPYFTVLFGTGATTSFTEQGSQDAGLATMTALAFFDNVSAKTRLSQWNLLNNEFGPALMAQYTDSSDFASEDPPIERSYLAAVRSAGPTVAGQYLGLLRSRCDLVIQRSIDLTNPADYLEVFPGVERYGAMIVSLLSQSPPADSQFPTVPLNPSQAP